MSQTLVLVDLEDLKALLAESEIKNEVWDTQEAARYLKCTPQTVSRYAKAGKIPGEQIGTEWKFSSIALYQLVSKNKKVV